MYVINGMVLLNIYAWNSPRETKLAREVKVNTSRLGVVCLFRWQCFETNLQHHGEGKKNTPLTTEIATLTHVARRRGTAP